MRILRNAPVFFAILFSVCSYGQQHQTFSVLITEIFADPSPSAGLPAGEFIELYNASRTPVELSGWKICDDNGQGTIKASFVLTPGAYVILCLNSSVSDYSSYGHVLAVTGFPSLDNNSEQIWITDEGGRIIHAIHYNKSWFRNPVKEEGGFTLEMIDVKNPCGYGQNWKASEDPAGGSPGRINSVAAINPDELPPRLLRTYTIDSVTIAAVFDEPLLPDISSLKENFMISHSVLIDKVVPVSPLFNEVLLYLSTPVSHQLYELTVMNICDCAGNKLSTANRAKLSLPRFPERSLVIINELLFNPKPGGVDYIELYNRSGYAIDAGMLYVANKTSSGYINIKPVFSFPHLLFPEEYLALTTDSSSIGVNYLPADISRIRQIGSLPSMPDDKGTIAVLEKNGTVVDEVEYDADWHFPLINNPDGVSLERVNPNVLSDSKNNWTSASFAVQYGTPGYKNSQYRTDLQATGSIGFTQKLFSPDNDGITDMAQIVYQMEEPGYMLTVVICDRKGRLIKTLAKNIVAGIKGQIYWDGTDENRRSINPGIYIMAAEIFNMDGKSKKFREVITLAKRY